MKFNIISDLHLELNDKIPEIIPTADNLILAGDIGKPEDKSYTDFLAKMSILYKMVFVIKGNHECYGKTVVQTDKLISEIIDVYPNIYYLNQSFVQIDDLLIIGTTLWSDIDRMEASTISMFISDFTEIKSWSVDASIWQHNRDLVFISNMIEKSKKEGSKLIIITHHAPVLGSVSDKFIDDDLNSSFQTDLSGLITDPIKLWVYGHTHCSKNRTINGVQIVSNQYGYLDEDESGYQKDAIWKVL